VSPYRLAPDASMIFCITWSRLKLAGFCRGGNSLRRLRAEGFEMRGVPPHLAWRIEEDGN
jgi:hypothetical protein